MKRRIVHNWLHIYCLQVLLPFYSYVYLVGVNGNTTVWYLILAPWASFPLTTTKGVLPLASHSTSCLIALRGRHSLPVIGLVYASPRTFEAILDVLNILVSYLQFRLKLEKKGGKGNIHVRTSVCRTVNKLSIHHEAFFCEDETSQSPICPVLDFRVAPQLFGLQMVLFQWILGEPYQGSPNPLQPPTKFLRGCWWGWHTVWANSVCPQKQGVFDVHK